MQIVEFQEQRHFTFWNFQNKLKNIRSINEEDLRDTLKRLELSHCVKHHLPLQDILEDSEELSTLKFENDYYKFTFVGIVIVRGICFIVYPKYWKDIGNEQNKTQKFIQILAVIDKYNKSNKYSSVSYNPLHGSNRLSNLIYILQDYMINDLYSMDEDLIEMNNEGQILWEKTIDESIAYMNDNTPIYLEVYTQTTTINERDIIRRLHAAVITEINEEIRELLSYVGLNYNFHITEEAVSDFGSNEHLLYLLDRELSKQFITIKEIMLRNIKNYIEGKNKQSDDLVQIYGTSNFNMVWEAVCSNIYDNNLELDMRSLELHRNSHEPNNSDPNNHQNEESWNKLKLKQYIEKPIWAKDNKIAFANKTLTLDVLQVDEKLKIFKIFDAKYYEITFKEDRKGNLKVSGQPGVGDITKQYLYQLAYKNLAEDNGYKFSNGFIIPKDDLVEEDLVDGLGSGKLLGKAKMKMLSNLGLVDITVIERDCYTVFKQFLNS